MRHNAYRTKADAPAKQRAIYVPLPERYRTPTTIGDCQCRYCARYPGQVRDDDAGRPLNQWDTLIVPLDPNEQPWTCHFPELHGHRPTVPDWLEPVTD